MDKNENNPHLRHAVFQTIKVSTTNSQKQIDELLQLNQDHFNRLMGVIEKN